jgi:cysteine desulfurase/selenocysteine lyase
MQKNRELQNIKSHFPLFQNNPDLIFLDSAASSQKPKCVLDAVQNFAEKNYANINRGAYSLSFNATQQFENARKNIATFLGVLPENFVCTKNGTEASNIFAKGFAENFLQKDDEILIPISEHHANILPWMRACQESGAKIVWVSPDENTVFSPEHFAEKISAKTKLITFAHVSNVTGQIFPIQEITQLIQKFSGKNNQKIFTFLDACQSIPHIPIDFETAGVDAGFFTGHKLGAPSGTGGLFFSQKFSGIFQNQSQESKNKNQKKFSPLILGGDIVEDVNEETYFLQNFPHSLEAGTPNIEGFIGCSEAVNFLEKIGRKKIFSHEKKLTKYALEQFAKHLPKWEIIGEKNPEKINTRIGNISFYHPNIHHADVGSFLAEKNIAVRTGFHCANPLHHFLNISGSVRASFWIYTQKEDIDALIKELVEIEKIFC